MGLILVAAAAAVVLAVLLVLRRTDADAGFHFTQRRVPSSGFKFACRHDGREVARTYLYVLRNDLHDEPFGFIEDVYVEPKYRGQGLVTRLHDMAVETARRRGCYKIVLSSRSDRPDVHAMYRHLGYEAHGVAFRLDLGEKKKDH